MQINILTIIIAILGAVKIVLQAFGLDIITDEQINAIANGVSAIATIGGVIYNHMKPKGDATSAGNTNTIGSTK